MLRWSPDGGTILFRRNLPSQPPQGPYLIDAATGANQRPLGGPHIGCCYDWQPIPINAYPRPKGASPMQTSLVPAYQPCTSPNRTHGPPLAFPSCGPPQRTPGQLTIGTADSNGRPTKSVSIIQIGVRPGIASTPADEADLVLFGTINDVRLALGPLRLHGHARSTHEPADHRQGQHAPPGRTRAPGPPRPSPTRSRSRARPPPTPRSAPTATFDTTVGGVRARDREGAARSIWELGAMRVYDGAGSLFMTQGIFVP